MKKILALLLLSTLLFTFLVSCNDPEPTPDGTVNVYVEKDHDTVSAKMATGEIEIAVLPEPKATAAILAARNAGQNYSIKLNLSTEWDKVSSTSLTMGCIIVRNEFLTAHEGAAVEFLKEYKNSIEFIGNKDNKTEAANMIVSAGILPKLPIAQSALTNLDGSIVYMDSENMKNALVGFYDAIGISRPDDSFYYSKNDSAQTDNTKIKIGVMNGPTGMGMAKLINDYGMNSDKYEFQLFSTPETAVAAFTAGEIDFACIPTNAAANLANKKSNFVSVAAINCLGSLYVVVKDGVEINSIADLKDKNVYYGVKTSTTEPILKHIITNNNLELKVFE